MKFSLKQTRLGLRNSTTRIAFRYGNACLTSCPQAVLGATIEVDGQTQEGYSGDCLPPAWFDKSPDKDYEQQVDDQLAVIALAEKTFLEEAASPVQFFPAWWITYERVQSRAAEWGLNSLLASFGLSMVERAVMDALARLAGLNLARAIRENIYSLDAGQIHPELAGVPPADWLPPDPRSSIFVRHTVGLGDPLSADDLSDDERLQDGFPQTLEDYVQQTGTCHFKIKVSNQLDHDLARLCKVAGVVEIHLNDRYHVALDGNEQYKRAEEFDELVDAISTTPQLQTLWRNTISVEQPLDRAIALEEGSTGGVRELGRHKPVIIDESDSQLESYRQACGVGYRGVSSKSCKGPVKSLLNAGLTWYLNQQAGQESYIITGEDLCSVGVIPVQSDLCLAATLGLEHVERNGHHYHCGLDYLPKSEQQAALAAHPDFYSRRHGRVAPTVRNGCFQIESLHGPGCGFSVTPDFATMQSPDQWQFESLASPSGSSAVSR